MFFLALSGFDPTENRPKLFEWINHVKQLTNPVYDEANDILIKLKELK